MITILSNLIIKGTLIWMFVVVATCNCVANMASPIIKGTVAGAPFVSKHVRVEKELLSITPFDSFQKAEVEVEYHIYAETLGVKIPLLFIALDIKDSIGVWLDGHRVHTKFIEEDIGYLEYSKFTDFIEFFTIGNGKRPSFSMSEPEGAYREYHLNDLQYFEIDLSQGKHVIKVNYVANSWTDGNGWINEYMFRYALSPIRQWKSFGGLLIRFDGRAIDWEIKSNLGQPDAGKVDSIAVWSLNELPADVILFSSTPEVSKTASFFISITKFPLFLFWCLFVALLHIWAIRLYRRKKFDKRFSWVMTVGSIIVPAIIMIGYIQWFPFVSQLIGKHVSDHSGYHFLIILFYPFTMPAYWIVMWLIDRYFTHKYRRTEQSGPSLTKP